MLSFSLEFTADDSSKVSRPIRIPDQWTNVVVIDQGKAAVVALVVYPE